MITEISSIIVACASVLALMGWRRDKLSEKAITMLSLVYSVENAFKRITQPKWGFSTPLDELETKYSDSHDLFIRLRNEYNVFKAVYGPLSESDFSSIWNEESKILKTLLQQKINKASDEPDHTILKPSDYHTERGSELIRNVKGNVKNIELNLRPYIDRPLLYWVQGYLKKILNIC